MADRFLIRPETRVGLPAPELLHTRGMQLRAAPPPVPRTKNDPLSAALLAAEMGEPFPFAKLPLSAAHELFESLAEVRVSVPYAAINLLGQLAHDDRADVRAGVARALPWFADLYPDQVERLLIPLACDSTRKVRTAVAEALADLIESSASPLALIERWERLPERGREVLEAARKSLPPPFGK